MTHILKQSSLLCESLTKEEHCVKVLCTGQEVDLNYSLWCQFIESVLFIISRIQMTYFILYNYTEGARNKSFLTPTLPPLNLKSLTLISLEYTIYDQRFSPRYNFAPREHSTMPRDSFGYHNWQCGIGGCASHI